MLDTLYTYEDWLEGNIPNPANDKKIDKLNYWTYISTPPRIEESEFKRIRKQQKKVFFELVREYQSKLIETFLIDCNQLSSKDQIEFLQIEKKNVADRLKNYDLLKKVKLGQWDPKAVTPNVCNNHFQSKYFQFNGNKTESGTIISFPEKHENINGEVFYSEDPSVEERMGNVIPDLGNLYKAHVDFRYKKELESISEFIPLEGDFAAGNITQGDLIEEEMPVLLNKDKGNIHHVMCKQILDSAESIPAGKFAFIDYVKREFDLRTHKLALEKANQFYMDIFGKKIYTSVRSYDSSLSRFHKNK